MNTFNDVRKNENKGFSLVELIVVIAIMAVLTAVLAPSLLQYVERSRAQKDDSAMGEVCNAIQLALSDQNIYDEVIYYTCYNNYSCYIDSDDGAEPTANERGAKIVTKEADGSLAIQGAGRGLQEYMFDDNARLKDERQYYIAGNMRGVTITFEPVKSSNSSFYDIAAGIVNKFVRTSAEAQGMAFNKKTTANAAAIYISGVPAYLTDPSVNTVTLKAGGTAKYGHLGGMRASGSQNSYLYNRVRSIVGDRIELTSQTYRNSEYTVFIRMGSTGGNQATAQDSVKVYGQWNGTNLTATAGTALTPST